MRILKIFLLFTIISLLSVSCRTASYKYNSTFSGEFSGFKIEEDEKVVILPVLFHVKCNRNKAQNTFAEEFKKNKFPLVIDQTADFRVLVDVAGAGSIQQAAELDRVLAVDLRGGHQRGL